MIQHTGDGQNNGNICKRDTFLYSHRFGPPFACNTSCIFLGIDSYKFCIISSAILYHSSWRTSYSCLTDDGGGNLLLTLLSESDNSGLLIFMSGNCAGQGRCWSPSSCSWNQDQTCAAVCMGKCLLEKLHRCLETTSGP